MSRFSSRPQPEPVGPGQESVWDYPRPPRLERTGRRLRVVLGGETIADTVRGWRVLETSHPPSYYLPRADFAPGSVQEAPGSSWCEWKGRAHYLTLVGGGVTATQAAWGYADPSPGFAPIIDHLAVYPGRVDACFVDDELVVAQPGEFYGGWITSHVTGPFKGGPGSRGW